MFSPAGGIPSLSPGGTLARLLSHPPGHSLFLHQPLEQIEADLSDSDKPGCALPGPGARAGAAFIGWVQSRAKSLSLPLFRTETEHLAHSRHSAVGASESDRRMFHGARKFIRECGKSVREAGNVG